MVCTGGEQIKEMQRKGCSLIGLNTAQALGKLNRGLSVIDSYKLPKEGNELTDDEVFLACALGWCVEWAGLIAANDGVVLRNHIPRILEKHFKGKPYYVDLLDLFNEVEFQTACGQMIDSITTLEGERDLSKYSMPL